MHPIRTERLGRIIAVTVVIGGMILGLFAFYANWMSNQLVRIGSQSVEETYGEVNQLFNELVDSRWKYLEFMHEYLDDDATNYAERSEIITTYRERIGFTYFFLLGDNGEYTSERAGTGTFAFDDKCLAALRSNQHSLIEAALPSGENIILFTIRIEPTAYEGTTYTAMAFAYNEHDIGEALKVDAFGESSRPYILGDDGIAIITSDRTTAERRVDNILTYLESVEIDGASYEEAEAAYRNQETATYVVHSETGDYYLSFQPIGFQNYMLGSFTPTESVNGAIDVVRLNTIAVISVSVVLLFLLVLFYIGVFYTRQIRHRDALLRTKDEAIQGMNIELAHQNVQLEHALEEAESANQAKTAFLSNVSHDIRTPMNAIVGFATLADREADDPTKVHEYIGKIETSSHHLQNLINEVLDFSKIEAGKTTLRPEDVCIATIVRRIDSMMRPQFTERHQTFDLQLDCIDNCVVEADELRLTQVLVNILSNANKYTPRDGTVEFCIQDAVDESMVRYTFVVRDNGIGMSEEYLAHLYDPFTREVQSMTNKVAGTGLGMAITKNLVDLMGGTIACESEQGVGTTFTLEFAFPLVSVDTADEAAAKQDQQERSIAGLHILIAEDNELNAEIITELLAIEGCETVVVENGRLCCEEFWRQPQGTYDVILMDVQMPEMDGYEATRTIRRSDHPDATEIPIIAMTANAFNEDKRDALDAGMNAHVAKPIDMNVLKKVICSNRSYSDSPAPPPVPEA